jgi:dTDP-glucose 4,6-dehydratase
MRLLVTGGLGFIGSHFIRIVLRERKTWDVINFDAMTYAGNPANCADVENDPRYRFVKGDIRDRAAVEAVMASGPSAVVNFAAETHVDRSILDPDDFIRTDVLGTHVLLAAALKFGIRRFLQVSTDEVYGEVSTGTSKESDALSPRSPYSASKAGGDLQVLSYWTTYKTPVLITRGSNTFGTFQYPEKLIPLFITNLIDGKPVPVYGDGLQERDWLHVDDHARGILHILEHGDVGNIYNLGGGNPKTNLAITQFLLHELGHSMETHVTHVSDRAGHDRRYAVDCSKARAIGWSPRMPFEESLSETIDWYRRNESWWRPLRSSEFNEYFRRQYVNRAVIA